MSNAIVSLIARRKKTIAAFGLPVLVAAWWAFRPEKLFIDARVNEPAPFLASSDPQPVLTGRLEGAGGAVGRATIYKTPQGRRYLRISGLSSSAAQLTAVLKGARSEINLGVIQGPGEQKFDLPATFDLNQYSSVAIYADASNTFAIAKFQPF
jgi:hypothetical protein